LIGAAADSIASRQSAHRWHSQNGRMPLLSARPAIYYLPHPGTSPPLCQYQIILPDDREYVPEYK